MPRTRPERIVMTIGLALVVVVLALGATAMVAGGATTTPVPTSAPAPATGATRSVSPTTGAPASAVATASRPGTPTAAGGYALDFTLPTFGKSGCLVCHADAALVVAKGGANVSYWIDEDAYNQSAHAKIICTGCHIDYGYKAPHGQAGQDWRSVAKQACKNCHPQEFQDWSLGAHAPKPGNDKTPDPKAASKPLCGDCHGSHSMAVLKNNPAGKAQLHAQSQQMCGRAGCHADYWANYSDYYHGAAYKAGAADAPACWDCHGTHTMLKSTDRFAPTNSENYKDGSCGRDGCHAGVTPDLSSYSKLIHGRGKAEDANPVKAGLRKLFGR
jgi:hypothetical protein